ncbi:MAG: NAD+ synthase [Bdellovibrionota bacterium]
MKIACAQIKPIQAGITANTQKIIEFAKLAAVAGAELVVFPELSIPGYLALDNFESKDFLDACLKAEAQIAQETKGLDCIIIVGNALGEEVGRPYNVATVIYQGEIVSHIKKTLLPEYDIFWEGRYFKSAKSRELVEVAGKRVAIQICEDLWDAAYEVKVTEELASQNPDLIINLSASPFHAGKISERVNLVTKAAKRFSRPFLYVNMLGALDGYQGEIVFDGRSLVVNSNGKLIALAKGFVEDLLIVDLKSNTEIAIPELTPAEENYEALILGIRDYLSRNGFNKVYIALSGGIDSAVVCALAVKALGPTSVVAVTMPSHITSDETLKDAQQLAENLGIQCDIREISELYKVWEKDADNAHGTLNSLTRQNIQARLRGAIMMEYTNQDRGTIVLSTGNKTEIALGYCTLYGDMCGGLSVIGDLSKLAVYSLAKYLNQVSKTEIIPESIITRVPTAELEENQTDKDNLPADYDILSPLVDLFIEDNISLERAVAWLKVKNVSEPEVIAEKTKRLIDINEYKRRQMAPAIRVTKKAFGAGRRYPL